MDNEPSPLPARVERLVERSLIIAPPPSGRRINQPPPQSNQPMKITITNGSSTIVVGPHEDKLAISMSEDVKTDREYEVIINGLKAKLRRSQAMHTAAESSAIRWMNATRKLAAEREELKARVEKAEADRLSDKPPAIHKVITHV